MLNTCRKVSIMSESAYAILARDSRHCTGNFYIDDDVLRQEGVTDFDGYAYKPGAQLALDFFLDDDDLPSMTSKL